MPESNDKTIDTNILRRAGLTESQAKGYLALLENGELTPTELADKTGESRTNGYMIAERLGKLGLIKQTDARKVSFIPLHPNNLEVLVEKRRRVIQKNEQMIKQNLDTFINLFYAANEMPGVKTFQDTEGVKSVYHDTLVTKKDIYLLRTSADVGVLGEEYLDKYRNKRALLGINTYALTPDNPVARKRAVDGTDEKMLFHRTTIPENTYTAPVEIDVYGDKVALIAFGDTQMATMVNSPPIAESMRQILKLLIQHFETL